MSRLKASDSRFASAGLSTTMPISVLRRAERGSKLNEPTKIRLRSTPNVLACRLASELPAARFLSFACFSSARGFSSSSRTPARPSPHPDSIPGLAAPQRHELACAHRDALPGVEASRIARAEGAPLAVVHGDDHFHAAFREPGLHLRGARGAELPLIGARRTSRHEPYRADEPRLVERRLRADLGRSRARGERGLGARIHLPDRGHDAVRELGKPQVELVDLGRGRGRDERDGGSEPAQPQQGHGYSARPWMKYVAESSGLGAPSGPRQRAQTRRVLPLRERRASTACTPGRKSASPRGSMRAYCSIEKSSSRSL